MTLFVAFVSFALSYFSSQLIFSVIFAMPHRCADMGSEYGQTDRDIEEILKSPLALSTYHYYDSIIYFFQQRGTSIAPASCIGWQIPHRDKPTDCTGNFPRLFLCMWVECPSLGILVRGPVGPTMHPPGDFFSWVPTSLLMTTEWYSIMFPWKNSFGLCLFSLFPWQPPFS